MRGRAASKSDMKLNTKPTRPCSPTKSDMKLNTKPTRPCSHAGGGRGVQGRLGGRGRSPQPAGARRADRAWAAAARRARSPSPWPGQQKGEVSSPSTSCTSAGHGTVSLPLSPSLSLSLALSPSLSHTRTHARTHACTHARTHARTHRRRTLNARPPWRSLSASLSDRPVTICACRAPPGLSRGGAGAQPHLTCAGKHSAGANGWPGCMQGSP